MIGFCDPQVPSAPPLPSWGVRQSEGAVKRRRWRVIATFSLGSAAVAGWSYFHQPAVSTLAPDEVLAVDVRFEPWGEDMAVSPGSRSADRGAVAALLAVLQSGTEGQDHKCASRGVITLRRSLGRSVELRFLPGHHAEWYEFRYAGTLYRVPRAEFTAAMRRVGID